MSTEGKATDVGLDTFKLRAITQVNRRTLPKLTLGTNRVRLSADEQVESTVLWPLLHAGQYRQTVFSEEDVYSSETADGIYKATLGSAVNGKECQATWRVEVPSDITSVTHGVVATRPPDDPLFYKEALDISGKFHLKPAGPNEFRNDRSCHDIACFFNKGMVKKGKYGDFFITRKGRSRTDVNIGTARRTGAAKKSKGHHRPPQGRRK